MTNNKIKPPITKSQSNKVAQKKNDCPEHSVEDKNLVKITQGSA